MGSGGGQPLMQIAQLAATLPVAAGRTITS